MVNNPININPLMADNDTDDTDKLLRRYQSAKERRSLWESHWQQCYDYALPQNDGALMQAGSQNGQAGAKKNDHLFDGTAADGVEQLSSSLMAALTPPWGQWFEIAPGHALEEAEIASLATELEEANQALESHFESSNIAVELHQAFLDLVTIGTASLLFEEAPLGAISAFRFTSLPMGHVVLEESDAGLLEGSFRLHKLSTAAINQKFQTQFEEDDHAANDQHLVLEVVVPAPFVHDLPDGYEYSAIYVGKGFEPSLSDAALLQKSKFQQSPFVNFRWLKVPGEHYGRSPVMKALPDIKTANKVVELILKNATIAVTGLWQAEDDGVLNPATVKLVPGAIIPKAMGSAGLTPLASPGQFDVSQLVLEDVRARIRHALLVDRLGPIQGERMTATEVLQRAGEMDQLLGASYGRLQAELLYPIANRAVAILQKRGVIPNYPINGHHFKIKITSPMAQNHHREEAKSLLGLLDSLSFLGPEALEILDKQKTAKWLASAMQVPLDLLIKEAVTPAIISESKPILQPQ